MKWRLPIKYPKITILIIAAITVFFGAFLPSLGINNDVVIFLPKNNPHRKAFEKLEDEFGKSDGIIVAATVKKGRIYNKKTVEHLMSLSTDFETIDSVDEVISVTTVDYVGGIDGGLETFPLIDEVPNDSSSEQDILYRMRSWEIYRNMLYTDDMKTALILIRPGETTIEEDELLYYQVHEITERYRDTFDFRIAGFPAVFVLVGKNMNNDLSRLIPFVVLVVVATLWFSFRRFKGVALPLLTVVISTIWALGLMSLLGIELTLIATVIPVLLVAVGSAYGIHVMAHYYDEYWSVTDASTKLSDHQHDKVIEKAMSGVSKPVTMAALTTMAGFGSLASSKIIPVRDFGIFTFVGVFAAFIVAITLIPSVLHFYHRNSRPDKNSEVNPLVKLLLRGIDRITHRPGLIMAIGGIIIVLAVIGTTKIRIGNPVVNFFKRNSTVWKANKWLQENTNGTVTLDIIIRGDKAGAMTDPVQLEKVDHLGNHLKNVSAHVTKVGSLVDLIKRMNVVMHTEERMDDPKSNYNEIPSDPQKYNLSSNDELQQLIAQYLLLFSGDIGQFTDNAIEPSMVRVIIQMNTNNIDTLKKIQNHAEAWLQQNIQKPFTWEISGTADAEIEVNRLIVDSQIKSILFSLGIVFIILALFYRSLAAGLFGMAALAIPLLINFGVMGLFKIPLDIATAMISSIAIGIGIDYIIHFMNAYQRELFVNNGSFDGISSRAIESTGKAIVFNAVSVAFGFAVILFSAFKPLNHLGGMIFLTMLTSSLVSLTILPVTFNLLKPSFLLKSLSKNR